MKRALSLLNEDYMKPNKQKRNKTKKTEIYSSDSDTNISLRESSASPFDDFEENEEDNDHDVPLHPENIKNGDFVLVKFEKKEDHSSLCRTNHQTLQFNRSNGFIFEEETRIFYEFCLSRCQR